MGLNKELRKLRDNVMQNVPAETAGVMAESMKEIGESGITGRARKKGDRMPSFDLPNVRGEMISSRTLLEQGPLVISFYRGSW